MNFKDKILDYENTKWDENYMKKYGKVPVILTAPHTMKQLKEDGKVKLNEPFTKAIALYIANELDCFYLIKVNDTKIDSNSKEKDEFKEELINIIKENDIKLSMDIHGASIKRDFDVEIGTLSGKSADNETIQKLIDTLNKYGIEKIDVDKPFKGGGITTFVNEYTDACAIQIEINARYRNVDDIDKLKSICLALTQFINEYLSSKESD